jgi:hypothetical protein
MAKNSGIERSKKNPIELGKRGVSWVVFYNIYFSMAHYLREEKVNKIEINKLYTKNIINTMYLILKNKLNKL